MLYCNRIMIARKEGIACLSLYPPFWPPRCGRSIGACWCCLSDNERSVSMKKLRILLYAAALLLIVAGILNGGMRDVLIKAINICTECIGLG